ncbi:unnamed protein product, partial [marine sediment metagenome]
MIIQLYQIVVMVQTDFKEFASKYSGINYNSIYYQIPIQFNNFKISFNCYNTACISQLNEKQGELIIPPFVFNEQ